MNKARGINLWESGDTPLQACTCDGLTTRVKRLSVM